MIYLSQINSALLPPELEKKFSISKSSIHGVGLFSRQELNTNTTIGYLTTAISAKDKCKESFTTKLSAKLNTKLKRTELEMYLNHSNTPNAKLVSKNNDVYLVAIKKIASGDEIVVDYRQAVKVIDKAQLTLGTTLVMRSNAFDPNLSTTTDFSGAKPHLPMADEKDFRRPGTSTWQGFAPDSAFADDLIDFPEEPTKSDNSIKLIQQFLKSSPLGISYQGPTDGYSSQELTEALGSLQARANAHGILDIVFLPPNLSSINKLIERLKDESPSQIKEFQKLFNQEPTGEMTPELIQAAKSAEHLISKKINDPAVIGMIIQNDTFKTSPSDVAQALSLLKDK